jgi:predicted nucleic acid-binding Zn ribbon protein
VAAARSVGAEGAVELAGVERRWAQLVGAQVAEHTWPESLRHGVLVVATDHHAWALELRALAGDIVKKLQAEGVRLASVSILVSHRERPGW